MHILQKAYRMPDDPTSSFSTYTVTLCIQNWKQYFCYYQQQMQQRQQLQPYNDWMKSINFELLMKHYEYHQQQQQGKQMPAVPAEQYTDTVYLESMKDQASHLNHEENQIHHCRIPPFLKLILKICTNICILISHISSIQISSM